MQKQIIRPVWPWVVLTLGSTGCADVQARRYQTLAQIALVSTASASASLMRAPLDRAGLISAVLERNPSVASARQAFLAALAEHPQAVALSAPTLEYTLAPASIASSDVRFGQIVRIGQKFPWPGKLAAQGEIALFEAEATKARIRRVQLELGTAAASLFDRAYAIARALEPNVEHEALVTEIQSAAQAQYAAGRAPQQDVLQAEVELSHVLHQRVVLKSQKAVIHAKLNGLLHRAPHLSLSLSLPRATPNFTPPRDAKVLFTEALLRRPELSAARSRVGARTAAIDFAQRRYFPDFGVMATYNSMWAQPEHQWMAGVQLSLPFVQLSARRAGVRQAQARLSSENAARLRLEDEVRVQVETARLKLIEAQHVVHLYRTRLLVAARAQIEAATAGYETGQSGFQALVAAERSFRALELQYEEAIAAASQRRAELAFAVGRMPVLEEQEGES